MVAAGQIRRLPDAPRSRQGPAENTHRGSMIGEMMRRRHSRDRAAQTLSIALIAGAAAAALAAAPVTTGAAVPRGVEASGTAAPAAVHAAAGTAYVRLNQVGFPAAADQARLPDEQRTGRRRHVRRARRRRRDASHGRCRQEPRRVERRVRLRVPHRLLGAERTRRLSDHGRRAGEATSPAFRVGSGGDLYERALRNTLRFYEVQRDGPRFVRSRLRTGGRSPARPARDDLPHSQGERRRRVPRRPLAARQADRRVGRLVGRRRLPQVPAHDRVHRGGPAGRHP